MKKEELLRDEITALELNISSIKKYVEIAKYLSDSVNGVITNVGFVVEEMERELKNIKDLLKLESEKK
jgi:hypothetical protein